MKNSPQKCCPKCYFTTENQYITGANECVNPTCPCHKPQDRNILTDITPERLEKLRKDGVMIMECSLAQPNVWEIEQEAYERGRKDCIKCKNNDRLPPKT